MQRGLGDPLSAWVSRAVYMPRGLPHKRHSTLRVQSPFGTLDGAFKGQTQVLPPAPPQRAVQQRRFGSPHVAIALKADLAIEIVMIQH